MLHRTDWPSIKQIRTDNNNLTLYYTQDGSTYSIIEGDRENIYWTVLNGSADITEFETTYKAGGISVISLDDAISKIFLNQDMNNEIVTAINQISGAEPTQLVLSNKLYSFADQINMDTSEIDNPIILLKNPSGSTKQFVFWRARFGILVQNNYAHYKFWVNPTITANGTSGTIVNTNLGGGAPSSQMEVYTLPTISNNGTLMALYTLAENGNSVMTDTEATIALQPGNSLLITGNPKSNDRDAMCSLLWLEVD